METETPQQVEFVVEEDCDESEQDVVDVSVIPVQLVDSSEGDLSIVKGKYYKQTYRPAWELLPHFKGWLTAVEGQPNRAFCIYCDKSLHAHRLSLLKHTCTIKHQKAERRHKFGIDKKKRMIPKTSSSIVEAPQILDERVLIVNGEAEDNCEDEENVDVDDDEMNMVLENELEEEEEDENEEYDDLSLAIDTKENVLESVSAKEGPIFVEVTDISSGRPVSGLQVSLYKLINGRWTYINEGFTNLRGCFGKFFEESYFTSGRYKLHYDVDRYYEAQKISTIYPFIEIAFNSNGPNEVFHILLLLGPNGYTTYRRD